MSIISTDTFGNASPIYSDMDLGSPTSTVLGSPRTNNQPSPYIAPPRPLEPETNPFPNHRDHTHNFLHNYLVDPANTTEIRTILECTDNGPYLVTEYNSLLANNTLRLSAIKCRARTIANEEAASNMENTHFGRMLGLGVLDYINGYTHHALPGEQLSP